MAAPTGLPEPTRPEAASLVFGTALFWFSFAMVCIIGSSNRGTGAVVFFVVAFLAALWLYASIFKIAGRAKSGSRRENLSNVLKFDYYKRAAIVLRLPSRAVLTALGTLLGVDVIAFVVLVVKSL